MVLATMTMAVACGANWRQAAALANIAGGLEVEKFGIVPITKEEIAEELHRQDADTRGKERTLKQVLKDLETATAAECGDEGGIHQRACSIFCTRDMCSI